MSAPSTLPCELVDSCTRCKSPCTRCNTHALAIRHRGNHVITDPFHRRLRAVHPDRPSRHGVCRHDARPRAAVQAGTARPFNVNFITIFAGQAQIDAVCAAGVAVASFHWGHPPRAWIDQLHTAGVRVFEQVGSVDDAKRAVDDGVDVVVAQGQEAGGHNYATLPTFSLVPLVVDAVAPALVLASGGIADGRGLAAALMLGADGVWVGTRFVATTESAAHDGYKSQVVAAQATDTVLTGIFGPDNPRFNPMRVLRNRVVRQWQDRMAEIPADTSGLPVIGHMDLGGQQVEMHKFSNLVPMRDRFADGRENRFADGRENGRKRGRWERVSSEGRDGELST